jgi:methylmalonyl-CoA mutase
VAAGAKEKLDAKKASRTEASVTMALNALNQELTMNNLEAALKHGATLAEVTSIYGGDSSSRVNPVNIGRLTEGYEALRDKMEAYVAKAGSPPKVLMAQMGPVKQYKIRSDFSIEFLKPGGFEVLSDDAYETAADAARAVIDSGAAATVICSTDNTYPDLVPEFAKAVKAGAPDTVVLMAGMLPDHVEAFQAAGVDNFIHLKANNLQLLEELQAQTGVDA